MWATLRAGGAVGCRDRRGLPMLVQIDGNDDLNDIMEFPHLAGFASWTVTL